MHHGDAQCSLTDDALVVMHVGIMRVKQPHMNRSDIARRVGGVPELLCRYAKVQVTVRHHRCKSTASVRYLSL